jgi:hypothetical protein
MCRPHSMITGSRSTERLLGLPRVSSQSRLISDEAGGARDENDHNGEDGERRLYDGVWHYMRRNCRCELVRVPVQASGIALNIVSIAHTLEMLSDDGDIYIPWEWLRNLVPAVSHFMQAEAAVLISLCTVRGIAYFGREHASLNVLASHCTLFVAVQLLASNLTEHLGWSAVVAVYTAYALGCVLSLRFLWLCRKSRSLPEPFWFTATVSTASFAMVGPSIGAPQTLMLGSLAVGSLLAALLWPACLWRVLRNPARVAPNPTVFVLMGPIPFVTMAMFSCRTRAHAPLLGPVGRDAFFILNVANVLICLLWAAAQRRRALAPTLRPALHPSWASLTFPLVANCYVSLFYANEYRLVADGTWMAFVSSVWSHLLTPMTLILVP